MRFIIVILLLISTANSFADAGNGYRFYVHLELNDSSKVQGYIYLNSWEKYEGFGNLKAFIKQNSPNKELIIFPHIVSVSSDLLNLDFALENAFLKINVEEISIAKETDILDFGGGVFRLKELNKEEFDLIRVKKPFSNHINMYEIISYCHLIFYSWDSPIEEALVNGVYERIKIEKLRLDNSLEGANGDKFYAMLDNLKKTMLKDNILLIKYCESC